MCLTPEAVRDTVPAATAYHYDIHLAELGDEMRAARTRRSMPSDSVTPPALPQTLDRARDHVLARRQRRRRLTPSTTGGCCGFSSTGSGTPGFGAWAAGLSRA
jgi:hypothetical protein